jgi:hypothetical protein
VIGVVTSRDDLPAALDCGPSRSDRHFQTAARGAASPSPPCTHLGPGRGSRGGAAPSRGSLEGGSRGGGSRPPPNLEWPPDEVQATDRWVCFDCRWTARFPLLDIRDAGERAPRYRCPACRRRLVWIGPKFRPPKNEDLEAWQVARELIEDGCRFLPTRERQRLPRTLKELAAWRMRRSAERRFGSERKVALVMSRAGTTEVRCGRRVLDHCEKVLVWHNGAWREGALKLSGDGGNRLARAVVTVPALRKSLLLTSGTRLRLLAN